MRKKLSRDNLFFVFAAILLSFYPLSIYATTNKQITFFDSMILENGMNLIIIENHSSPMIASVIFVKAGSANEDEFSAGLSHFLEHLLFDGTTSSSREEITQTIDNLSGYINAFTRKEYTSFLLCVPRENFEDGLELQKDMLFNSILPDEEVEKERKVILEEINKDLTNPESNLSDLFYKDIFKGHQLSKPILGYKNLIKTVKREKIFDYYRERYKPANMTVFCIGDFEKQEIIRKVKKIFEDIPSNEDLTKGNIDAKFDLEMLKDREQSPVIEEVQGLSNPEVKETYIGPSIRDKNFPAFFLLSRILGNQVQLEKLFDPLSTGEKFDLEANLEIFSNFSLLSISYKTKKELLKNEDYSVSMDKKMLGEIKKFIIGREFSRFLNNEITSMKVEEYSLLDKLHYFPMFNSDFIFHGGDEVLNNFIPELEKVKDKEISSSLTKFMEKQHPMIFIFNPEPEFTQNQVKDETPQPFKTKLDSGAELIVKTDNSSHMFAIHVIAKNRVFMEPEGKQGISELVFRMLDKGADGKNFEQIESELSDIGAKLTLGDNPYIPFDDRYLSPLFSYIRIETLDEYAEKGIQLLCTLMEKPDFPQEFIEKEKMSLLSVQKFLGTRVMATASNLVKKQVFGEDSRVTFPIFGTRETISSLTMDDLHSYQQKYLHPENLIITVAGNVPAEKVAALFNNFLKKPSSSPFIPIIDIKKENIIQVFQHTAGSIKEVKKKFSSKQVGIYICFPVIPVVETEIPALEIMIQILSKKVGMELREKQGLAYSVGADLENLGSVMLAGVFIATSPEKYEQSINGINSILKELLEKPPDQTEFQEAKSIIRGSFLRSRLSRINQAFYLGYEKFLGFKDTYEADFLKNIAQVKQEDAFEVFKKAFNPDNKITGISGNFPE